MVVCSSGHVNQPGLKFCGECGKRLDDEKVSAGKSHRCLVAVVVVALLAVGFLAAVVSGGGDDLVLIVVGLCILGTVALYLFQQCYIIKRAANHVMEDVSESKVRPESHEALFGTVPKCDIVFWTDYAVKLRRGFLERTNANAEKWRNVFSGMLAVFGALVIIGGPGAFQDNDRYQAWTFVIVMASLTLALNAVFYAGFAANGMPKMWLDLGTPEAVRSHVYRQASNSLVRLYVALACGLLSIVLVIIGIGVGLASASDF